MANLHATVKHIRSLILRAKLKGIQVLIVYPLPVVSHWKLWFCMRTFSICYKLFTLLVIFLNSNSDHYATVTKQIVCMFSLFLHVKTNFFLVCIWISNLVGICKLTSSVSGIIEKFNDHVTLAIMPRMKSTNKAFKICKWKSEEKHFWGSVQYHIYSGNVYCHC